MSAADHHGHISDCPHMSLSSNQGPLPSSHFLPDTPKWLIRALPFIPSLHQAIRVSFPFRFPVPYGSPSAPNVAQCSSSSLSLLLFLILPIPMLPPPFKPTPLVGHPVPHTTPHHSTTPNSHSPPALLRFKPLLQHSPLVEPPPALPPPTTPPLTPCHAPAQPRPFFCLP